MSAGTAPPPAAVAGADAVPGSEPDPVDDAAVAFFAEHGWWAAPPILPHAMIDDAMAALGPFYAGVRERRLPPLAYMTDWVPGDGEDALRLNGYASLQSAAIDAIVRHPAIGRTAARLLGAESVRLFHDRLIHKPAGLDGPKTTVGWHVDRAYWQTCTTTKLLTAWIPLTDCPDELGPLMVLDRSNHWAGNDWMRTAEETDLADLERRIDSQGAPLEPVRLALAKGAVSFHHCLTVHGSAPNTADRARTALAVHIQAAENRWRPYTLETGRAAMHLNDVVCRRDADGHPDYTDPAVFPVLWPPEAADGIASSRR
ncbi:MAG: phytanoyl-CoA dioxygenase family protein [Azospirillaceae bacterium]